MKNFSDLTAIESRLRVCVRLTPIVDNGAPDVIVCCRGQHRGQTWQSPGMFASSSFEFDCGLEELLTIEIGLRGKRYSQDRETAVIIDSITIDDFEMIPAWTHLARYQNDRGYQGATNYLGFNGTWTLSMSQPFYQWKHQATGQGWLLHPVTATVRD